MALRELLTRRGLDVGSALTTPFLPKDYLGLLNPLWTGGRARVIAVRPEAAGATTLVLKPSPGFPSHLPGQYVGVGVDIDGVRHWRSYSVTSPGGLTITVKAQGSVSDQLALRTPVGAVLQLRPPQGEFTWHPGRPALLLTAGSGITPVMGMLRGLAARGPLPDIDHVHSARTADDVIFGAELRTLADSHGSYRLTERHTADAGRLSMAGLELLVPDWRQRETYVCGPAALTGAVETHWALAGLRERLHVERFTPPTVGSGASGEVSFTRTGAVVRSGKTLLEAGEEAGVLMPSGCRMGICFTCVVPLRQGQVRDARTGEVHGEPGDLVQTCISTPAGDCSLDV